jgi:ADP-ribosyl-[dinitrogen reductase] hydrolase
MDAALGCLLGAAVGDAAGATLEFESRAITADLATAAMGMPGGGVLGVGPGQVTDDTELALSLANGLLGHHPQEGFPQEAVSEQYYGWLRSAPFDVGGTCRAAFSARPGPASMQASCASRAALDVRALLNAC